MTDHTRLQITLNIDIESDTKLKQHFLATKSEMSFKSDAAALRHILERDRQVSRVYGASWDWRNVVKAPPWMEKIIGAITALDGRATVIVQDKEDDKSQIVFKPGLFDE